MDKNSLERRDHERSRLSEVTREKEIILKNVTRISNHIEADLTVVFPEFSSIMSIGSKTGMAILEKYTTPETISELDPEKLLKFMQKNGRNHFKLRDAQNLIELAVKSVGVPDAEGTYSFRLRMNVQRLRSELSALKCVEREIVSRSEGNEHIGHLMEMMGIGAVNAAIIVS